MRNFFACAGKYYFYIFKLDDTNAKLVICTEETAENAQKAIASVEDSTKKKVHLFSFGDIDGVENILAMLDDLLDERMAPDPVEIQDTKNETCIIFWSSGTTGLPKGICHSHFSALHLVGFAKDMVEQDSPQVTTTCFFHIGGFTDATISLERRLTYHHVSEVLCKFFIAFF